MLARAIAIGFFSTLMLATMFTVERGSKRDGWFYVCDLVNNRFVRPSEKLTQLYRDCQEAGRKLPWFASEAELFRQMRSILSVMEVSHLDIYEPVDEQRMWRGESYDTGIRAIGVNGRIFIFQVLEGSPAADLGLQPGVEILLINGEAPQSLYQIETQAGEYFVRSAQEDRVVTIEPRVVNLDERPKLIRRTDGAAILSIPSFRGALFENWQDVAAELKDVKGLVVDLRWNSGGNFAAMLRVISTFACSERQVGILRQPRKQQNPVTRFPDQLDDLVQIEQMENSGNVNLITFKGYGCYKGPVVVLVNEQTASAAEVFADALTESLGAKLMGRPTAGDVLLAIWYDIPQWGRGYSLSVPEALYVSKSGKELEQEGVWPDVEANYRIEDLELGKDSWIEGAVVELKRAPQWFRQE